MEAAGFQMIIISNNYKKRVKRFGAMFGLDTLSFAIKPLPVGYLPGGPAPGVSAVSASS